MAVVPVVRLFGFRPTRPAFDNAIRDLIVPTICAQPGAIDVYAGRHGPDELGPRMVVSVWESRAAMEAAFGGPARPGEPRPEALDGITDASVEVLQTEIAYHADDAREPARIIRILSGCTQPGQLERYIQATRAGVAVDVAEGHGPLAFYLAHGDTPEGFVAVSTWSGWSAIEAATGGDIREPLSTRRPELIETYDATHFEIIDL